MSFTINFNQASELIMAKNCTIDNSEQLQFAASPSTDCNENMSETSEIINIKAKKATKVNKMVEEDTMSTDVSRKTSYETNSDNEDEDDQNEQDSKEFDERRDNLLKNLAVKCKHDWKKVAKSFNNTEGTNMSPVALKQRFKKVNKGEIQLRVKFDHQEDLKIVKYFDIYGCNWSQIATHFTDRTAIMLKNRYYSHIRKRNLYDAMLEEVKGADNETQEVQHEVQPEVQQEQVKFQETIEAAKNFLIPTRNTSTTTADLSSPSVFGEEFEEIDFNFFGEKDNSWLFRKLSMRTDNYFDMENMLTSELHERITVNYY